MPRSSLTISKERYHHILLKGIVHYPLFRTSSDFQQFLNILEVKKNQFSFKLLGYCLLEDQAHLIIEEVTRSTLPSVVHGLSILYTKYYQSKYSIEGSIFSGKYQSELIHLKKELICRLRHIHQKPKVFNKEGGLNYIYSSYTDYLNPLNNSIINRGDVFNLFDKQDHQKASHLFISIHSEMDTLNLFDEKEELYKRVLTAKKILKEELTSYNISYDELQKPIPCRDHLILKIHTHSELNQQEIADLLGISRHIVGRVIRYNRPN